MAGGSVSGTGRPHSRLQYAPVFQPAPGVIGTVFKRLIPPGGAARTTATTSQAGEPLRLAQRLLYRTKPTDERARSHVRHRKVPDPRLRPFSLAWTTRPLHTSLRATTWAIDIAPFPPKIATINLFRRKNRRALATSRPVSPGLPSYQSPGPNGKLSTTQDDPERPQEKVKCIRSFRRHHQELPLLSVPTPVERTRGRISFIASRDRLITDWFNEYPKMYDREQESEQEGLFQMTITRRPAPRGRIARRSGTGSPPTLICTSTCSSTQHDSLRPTASMGIVTSNAWLDVNYGYELQKFFLKQFKVIAVLESQCEPWFSEGPLMTLVTILKHCINPVECDNHLAKFVKVTEAPRRIDPRRPGLLTPTGRNLLRLRIWLAMLNRPGANTTKNSSPGHGH